MRKRVLISISLAWALISGSALATVTPATRAVAQVTGRGPAAGQVWMVPTAGQAGGGPAAWPADSTATLLAAGDIAPCSDGRPGPAAVATAALIGASSGTVAALGDLVDSFGALRDYIKCYDPAWGKFKSRTRPALGNHDYMTPGARDYFTYWGSTQAGPRGKGYYSYNLGTWHIVVLNANCSQIPGGCGAGSPQEKWLHADLVANPAHCTLAYWHQPLFTSGTAHPGLTAVRPLWQDLYQAGAEIVLSGHNHQYERFAPQTPTGAADPAHGIREFVVGTGGAPHYGFGTPKPNSQVRNHTANGVLKLTLAPGSYRWKFLPVAGQTFTDSGTGTCH